MRFSFIYQESHASLNYLACARIISLCLLNVLGIFLIDHPLGFYNPGISLTLTGGVLMVVWIVLTLMSLVGILARQVWAHPLSLIMVVSSAITFALAIPDDPLLSGALVFCQIYLIMCIFFMPCRVVSVGKEGRRRSS